MMLFEKVAREKGFYSEELMRRIAQEGTVRHIESIPEEVRRVFACAHDIDYSYHVRMQAAFQRHTDNAVSKTINFPHEATVEQVRQAYLMAWDSGLKGITVYRDGSRRSQVLNISRTDPLKRQDKREEMLQEIGFDDTPKKLRSAGRGGTVTSPRINGEVLSISSLSINSLASVMVVDDMSGGNPVDISRLSVQEKCPQCGSLAETFLKYEACRLCVSCGYTRC